MPKNRTQCPWPGLEPCPLKLEASALTMGPSHRKRECILSLIFVCGYKHAQRECVQYPAILTKQAWSIKDLLKAYGTPFPCGRQWDYPEHSSIFPARVTNNNTGFGSLSPLRELAILLILKINVFNLFLTVCLITDAFFLSGVQCFRRQT